MTTGLALAGDCRVTVLRDFYEGPLRRRAAGWGDESRIGFLIRWQRQLYFVALVATFR